MTSIYSKGVLPVSNKLKSVEFSANDYDRLRQFFEILIQIDKRIKTN